MLRKKILVEMKQAYLFVIVMLVFCRLKIYALEPGVVFDVDTIPIFNTADFSAEETDILLNGDILIRNIGTRKKMSLNPTNDIAKKIISDFIDLDPAYLVEIIQIRFNVVGDFNHIRVVLENIDDYTDIPYYSVQNGTWHKLYDNAVVSDISRTEDATHMAVVFYMNPFGMIENNIIVKMNKDSLYYESVNVNKIKWRNITCVQPYHMKSIITIFPSPDGQSMILYGLGGADAPSIFFLRKRIETALLNRVKSFCTYVFEKF